MYKKKKKLHSVGFILFKTNIFSFIFPPLKSYYDFWIEFVMCLCIRTFFSLPYACVHLFVSQKKKYIYIYIYSFTKHIFFEKYQLNILNQGFSLK